MDATRVTTDEIKKRMDRGEPIRFIDSRNPKAWGESAEKLPGATRIPVDEIRQYADELPRDRTLVTYCT
jgi:rhodanese-related sulfurtransferase